MKKHKTKGIIYLRIFSVFLATYLVLMIGFSVFLVFQERQVTGMELRTYALQINNSVESILQNYLDNDKQITDISKVKNELLQESSIFTSRNFEGAVFTGDYELLFNTNNYWQCSYTKYKEGNKHYTGYGYLNPMDWFGKEEIGELEGYLYANPQPKKVGDLSEYTLNLQGFWVDNGMIIPEKITVNALYAQKFDEEGNLRSSGGVHTDDISYLSGYKNTRGLPYFEWGSIIAYNNGNPNSEKRNELRQVVSDPSKLKKTVQNFTSSEGLTSQRLEMLTYRYYLSMPYQNSVRVNDDQSLESDFWTVIGCDINIGERCFPTLAFVWLSCLITFSIAALILARQTFKTYKQQEELENQRKEMTNALAHDLKTPLSIISGYAQNLQENVHTDKREHYANHIQANVNRMDKIIHKMLELTRLESDSLQIKFEDVALDEVCKKIIDRYKLVGEDKSITISLEGKALIKADYSLIARVVDNFLVNAIENTPEGGSIKIRIFDDTVEIYNSGSRIPQDKIDEIWLPFKKGDVSRSHTKGTGLGLAISRAILELHNFSYGAENRVEGVIFWFRFR
ncbi:sensor histidine kinase [Desulforamulus ferrireducens]|uniref:histidine kinase n=1 Tax=Desulforamulus ferrireducens TaxID=1833852 RepID=A0A1S6IYN0_9FIRM|nr:HAMP domain-containing sensor histidine kinase [Desulforamulus ferrireducens]AQS59881.1 two-component sensor histidine kinase [Desulforamulus ferrireducens]